MLIVNADDWGHTQRVTDAILAGFDAGVVTSTTAMVYMRDTARSADVARERGLPVGLHVNLTAPLEGREVPARVRERQLKATEWLTRDTWRTGTFDGDPALVRDAVRDQLEAFYERFGRPTHVDGHHHVHVLAAVLDALPPDVPVRGLPRPPAEVGGSADPREARLRDGRATPDLTIELHRVDPLVPGAGEEALALAGSQVVEVVTHPIADLEVLTSERWRAAVAGLPLGSYRDLARDGVIAPDEPVGAAAPTALAAPPAGSSPPCSICGSTARVDYHDRPDAVCPSCGSLERQRALARLLAAHPPSGPDARCLEVGPRNALVFGDWLRARGWSYEAVDKWELRGRADPDALGTYIDHDSDLGDLHFAASGAYELFLLQHVLEEVRDFRSALDEISRILGRGGTAYLEIPWKPSRAATAMKPPDVYDNVWAFGADLLGELRARFTDVEVVGLGEGRYRGDFFVCRHR